MANNQNLSRRAMLRQQQELEQQRRRRNRVIGIGAGIVALALIVVIAVVAIPPILNNRGIEVTENQQTPPNATAEGGIMQDAKMPTDGVPNVIVYIDFQCPYCAEYEATYGPAFAELVEQGKITVEHRTAYFLDGDKPGASHRAAIAAATADAFGKYRQYADVLFQNQSSHYPEKDLRDTFAKQAGIEGEELKQFQELLRTRAYQDFTKKAHDDFMSSGAGGTPTYLVNGQKLIFGDPETNERLIQPDAASLLDAITKAQEGTDAPTHQPLEQE